MIHGSHSHTFYLIDTCIFNILQDISNDKLYECIFLNSNLLIAFEKITQNDLIKINVINAFYLTPEDVKDQKFDGLIITGAPVEQMPFEEVGYWNELCEFMEWSKENVTTTFHICWGAQAGLYYHYGVDKYQMDKKLFGVYEHKSHNNIARLLRGFDDCFYVPHSRYTGIKMEDVEKNPALDILASSKDAGLCICASHDRRQIFMLGHLEYDRDTLKIEYERDKISKSK